MIATMIPAEDSYKKKLPKNPPYLTIFGPDEFSQIKIFNPNGYQVAAFSVGGTSEKEYTISRLFSPNHPPKQICDVQYSSMSGKTTFNIHGFEGRNKTSSKDLLTYFEVTLPSGKVKWHIKKSGSSGKRVTWEDDRKNVIAAGSFEEKKLEIFAPLDELACDCLLCSWVGAAKKAKADASSAKTGLEVFNAVIGLGGIGG